MQGLAGDYQEIMNRVEESRLAHEKRIKQLKLAKLKRDKELKEVLQVLGYFTLIVSLIGSIIFIYMAV